MKLPKVGKRRKVLLVLLAVFWIPLIVFAFLNLNLVTGLIESDNFEKLKRASEVQASSIDTFLKSNYEQIHAFANSDLPRDILSQRKRQRALSLKDVNVLYSLYVTGLQVLDPNGTIKASYDEHQVGSSLKNEAIFSLALSEKKHQMQITSNNKISPEIRFSAPVLNEFNKAIGVVIIRYSATVLQQVVGSHHDLMGDGSYGLIIDNHGNVVGATNDFDLGFERIEKFDADLAAAISSLKNQSSRNNRAYSKLGKALAREDIKKTGWQSVYIQRPTATARSLSKSMDNVLLILGLVLLLALTSTMIIYVLIRKLHDREWALKKANKEIMADLVLGNQVQQALQYVPKLPHSMDFKWHQQAAKHVSGDLCFTHWNSTLEMFTFMLIDVNGKGVQAALKAAAFSSIAQSVWTSRDSYTADRNRFDIFVATANRFIQSTQFREDFLAVVACEYHAKTNEARLFRLNYTSPLLIALNDSKEQKSGVQRLHIPNAQTATVSIPNNHAIVLLGDAFVGSSRQEKDIVTTLEQHIAKGRTFNASDLTKVVLEWHKRHEEEADDQTMLVLKKVA